MLQKSFPEGSGVLNGTQLRSPLVLASDIHLRDLDDSRGLLLFDVIRRIEPGAVEYFVLNGDIFDFCFGESRFFQEKYRPLGEALGSLSRSGTRVIFVEGNHEFHMNILTTHGGWEGVEFITAINHPLTLKDGTRIKLAHGDLVKDEPSYRAFRALVKSRFACACAKFIPGSWLDAYALRHATVSRATDVYRRLDHEKLLKAANIWLDDGDFEHGIFGHFHVPYAEQRATGHGKILSVDSWDKPNLLLFERGEFSRIYLTEPGAIYDMQPVQPFLKS